MLVLGNSMRFVPAERPPAMLRLSRAAWARCTATSDEEQAVSIPMQGPFRLKAKDTLPEEKLRPLPVSADVEDDPATRLIRSGYSVQTHPT